VSASIPPDGPAYPTTQPRSTTSNRRRVLGLLATVPLAGTALAAAPMARAAVTDPVTGPTPVGPADHTVAARLEQLLDARAAADLFSGTVLLAHHGRPVLTRSYGWADREASRPNAPDTVFNLASVSKCFVGVAVAQLVAAGRMTFVDQLGSHLDGFPAAAAGATIHQMLTHTSGIGRPALGAGTPAGAGAASFTEAMDATLATVRQLPVQFTPGTRFAYSNDGYWILGAVVAQVSGEPFDQYVRRHVFAPAGMTASGYLGLPEAVADASVARPYWTQPGGTRVDFTASPYAPYTTGPAGGAYASAGDLLAFARALRAGRLVEPSFVDLATSGKYPLPPTDLPTRSHAYGYGYEDDIAAGGRVFGHSGSGAGVATRLDVVPAGDWVLVVLGNYDTTITPIVDLVRGLVLVSHP
jgi:CubicO group peptidase (beta-lactamase class C family)